MYQVGTNKGITLHEITTTRCVIAQLQLEQFSNLTIRVR